MSIKILTANGIDNTNIDGARDAFFNSGMRDGIVKGALNEGTFGLSSSNVFYLDTCELRIAGHRVVIDEALYKTFSNKPSTDTRYSFIAQIVVNDNSSVEFSIFVQSANTTIRKDNLYAKKNGAGTYQVEIGRLTLLTDGTITDIVRTIDVITGNGNIDVDYIRIGKVKTNMLETGLDAEVDVENVVNEETGLKETNFTFSIPKSAGSVVNVGGEQVATLNFTSDPQTQIDERAKVDASNLTDENVASWNTTLSNKPVLDITSFSGTLSELCEEIVNNYRTKRIFFNLSDIYENQQIANIIPKPIDYNNNNIPCEIRNVTHGAKNYYCCIEIIAFNGGSQNNQSSVCYLIKTSTGGLNETVTLTEWCLLDTKNNAITFAEEERQKSKNLYTFSKTFENTLGGGVDVKFDKEKEQISFNGTATSAFSVGSEIQSNIYLKKGEYTFSIITKGTVTSSSYKVLYFYFKNGTPYETINIPTTNGSKESKKITLTKDEVLLNISFDISNGTAFDNCIFDIQIEEGPVATDYQQYNGAIVHEKLFSQGTLTTPTEGSTLKGVAHVVESYLSSDGLTWYRKWSDGWKECGIKHTSGQLSSVTLPISFSNINYNVNINENRASTSSATITAGTSFMPFNSTVNSFKVQTSYGESGNRQYIDRPVTIYCCGY